MLIILNGVSPAIRTKVTAALLDRLVSRQRRSESIGFESTADPRAIYRKVRASRARGVQDFVLVGALRWAGLRELRRGLAPLDPTSYAFRLVHVGALLGPQALSLQRRLDREEREGDVGFPVPYDNPEQAATFIWHDIREAVHLRKWSPAWADQFARERDAIVRELGDVALSVDHIGSTSVDGLDAKPVIDIAITVPSLVQSTDFIPPLRRLGYVFCDYPANTERYFFRKGRPRSHHLHVTEPGAPDHVNQIRFRDALRKSPTLRKRYVAMKRELAEKFGTHRARYSAAKGGFVNEVLARAK